MTKKRKPINNTNIPQYAIDRLARCFYPDIIAFYETEEGKRILQELKQQTINQDTLGPQMALTSTSLPEQHRE